MLNREHFEDGNATAGESVSTVALRGARHDVSAPAPILLTGSHRSGTTWVGRILDAAPGVYSVYEPFNYNFPAYGVCNVTVQTWYQYVCIENEASYLNPIRRTIERRYEIVSRLRRLRGMKDACKASLEFTAAMRARALGSRVLFKDPLAFFSAPWLSSRFGMQTVVLVRHPGGFVSSLLRKNWRFDFRCLLQQNLLMQGPLAPYRDEVERAVAEPPDIVGQGALLWKLIYETAGDWRETHPEWVFVRHEDLSADPSAAFEQLFKSLGLHFGPRAARRVLQYSTDSGVEMHEGQTHFLTRDSRTVANAWRERIDEAMLGRIRKIAGETFERFYKPSDW